MGDILLVSGLGLGILFVILYVRSSIVYEYEQGILYRNGKFVRVLNPGRHWYLRVLHTIQKVDMRTHSVSIAGQEVMSSDNVSVKVSLVVNHKVDNPYRAVIEMANYSQTLYFEIQVNLRDIVGEIPIDEFLSKRQEIGSELLARTREQAAAYGVLLESVAVRDVMFPGDMKHIFAQVVNARKEGLAALERARGESAALRNLANAANLLEKNPGLLQLRILQALENNPGNTIILGDISDRALLNKVLVEETSAKE